MSSLMMVRIYQVLVPFCEKAVLCLGSMSCSRSWGEVSDLFAVHIALGFDSCRPQVIPILTGWVPCCLLFHLTGLRTMYLMMLCLL